MGIALGLNVVNDSTLSTTDRTITAGGAVTFAAHASAATAAEAQGECGGGGGGEGGRTAADKKTFDPGTKVNVTDNTIDLGADHGLKTGDAVVYSKGTGTAIGGLTEGKTYYVITDGDRRR